ncbi:MAG TPA: MetQ/NlpA family ABC transporter substrate-binding protein [Oscillospiraceae bacterium]|nr:MetQ/NlpA family ABC transporter substrate-binding protein [Oscillospiraceae bacterium]
MKKFLALILALVLCLSFAACAETTTEESTSSEEATSTEETESEASSETPITQTLIVGASPSPHAEILRQVVDTLAAEGIDLQIVEFTDYVLPNEALTAGEIDANYFQHQPYLDVYNAENGTDIVSAGAIHYEPLGIYPGKTATLEEIQDGASIAIPNDGSNEARALYLLQDLGLITVDNTNGYNITVLDITDNPKNLEITEIEAAQLPQILPDVDFAIINGNYAIGAGIDGTVLTTEDKDSDAAQTYANIIAVLPGNEDDPRIVALIDALKSEEVRTFINDTYGIAVVPMF